MNLTLVISSLRGGGSERVISLMANWWAARGRAVTVLTMDQGGSPPFYPLHEKVRHRALGTAGHSANAAAGAANNLRRVAALRRAIKDSRPDAVISFLDRTNILTLLATRGLGVPVVVSERNDPAHNDIGRMWRFLRLRELTYPRAAAVVVQTRGVTARYGPAIRGRIQVIPNPVPPAPPAPEGAGPALRRPALLAVGSLHPQKGFDLLLAAFASLSRRHPDWSLTILGDGPLRAPLLQTGKGLGGRFQMPGRVRNVHDFYRGGDIFVLSSRWEGFPNVLCEALAAGLPAVAADCPFGPAEILRPGIDGLLFPAGDAAALEAALDRLMGDHSLRAALAGRAPEVVQRFSLERVMGLWDQCLDQALGGAATPPAPSGERAG